MNEEEVAYKQSRGRIAFSAGLMRSLNTRLNVAVSMSTGGPVVAKGYVTLDTLYLAATKQCAATYNEDADTGYLHHDPNQSRAETQRNSRFAHQNTRAAGGQHTHGDGTLDVRLSLELTDPMPLMIKFEFAFDVGDIAAKIRHRSVLTPGGSITAPSFSRPSFITGMCSCRHFSHVRSVLVDICSSRYTIPDT